MVPIILLCGNAGAGKDTIAGIIRDKHGAAVIAQADPMKRLALSVFQFSEEQLWGPSPKRSERLDGYSPIERWTHARMRLLAVGAKWLDEVLAHKTEEERDTAKAALKTWFDDMREHYRKDPESTNPTARHIIQQLGTEYGRNIDPDMWSKTAIRTAEKLLTVGGEYSRDRGVSEGKPKNWAVISDGRFRNEIVNVRKMGGIAVLVLDPSQGETSSHPSEAELRAIPHHFYDYVLVNDKSLGLTEDALQTNRLMNRLELSCDTLRTLK